MRDRKLLFFSWDVFAAIALIILGWFFRVREFLANRSLWVDEAMLALNLVQRNLFELFLPLDYGQGAPLGFLFVQKVIIFLLGENELRLRLFPLAAGCLVLVFAYLLARTVFSTAGTLFFLAIMALSPGLIYYSAEVKQYSSDVLIIVFLLWLWSEGLSVEKKQTSLQGFFSPRKVSFCLLIVGAFAIWFAHPAVFVLAAIGVIWFLDTMFTATRRGDALKFMVFVGVTWLISFLLLYWVSLRNLAGNEFLSNYWQENFVQFNLGWFQQSVNNLFADVAELGPHSWLFLIMSFLGVIYLWKSQKQFLGTILLIFVFTLLASALNKYPFYGRLMLFSVPLLFLLLAAGVDAIFSISRRFSWLRGGLAVVCAFAVLYYPLSTSVERYNSPRYYDHIRPAIVYFSKNFQPGDTLYVYYWTVPVVRYYSFFHPYSEEDIFPGVSTSPSGMFSEVQGLSDDERVWLVFSHLSRRRQENMEQMLLLLDQNGEQKDSFSIPGTGVFLYLYDLSPK